MDEYFKKKSPSLPNSNYSTIESSHPLVTIESVPNPSTSSMEPEPGDVPTPLSDLNTRAPCQPWVVGFSENEVTIIRSLWYPVVCWSTLLQRMLAFASHVGCLVSI